MPVTTVVLLRPCPETFILFCNINNVYLSIVSNLWRFVIIRYLSDVCLAIYSTPIYHCSDRHLRGLLPGQHPGVRLVGDGAGAGPGVRRARGPRQAVRRRADRHRPLPQGGLLQRLARTPARLHVERGEWSREFLNFDVNVGLAWYLPLSNCLLHTVCNVSPAARCCPSPC